MPGIKHVADRAIDKKSKVEPTGSKTVQQSKKQEVDAIDDELFDSASFVSKVLTEVRQLK